MGAITTVLKIVVSIVLLFLMAPLFSEFFYAIGYVVSFVTFPFSRFSANFIPLKPWVSTLYLSIPLVFLIKFTFKHIIHIGA